MAVGVGIIFLEMNKHLLGRIITVMMNQKVNGLLGHPALIAFWDFQEEAGQGRVAKGPFNYVLKECAGHVQRVEDGIFGPFAASFQFGDWLSIPRVECPELDFHGEKSDLTIIAWLKREENDYGHCQAVAGIWNETEEKRQYAMFLNLRIWDSSEQVGGHVSSSGGPTPGHPWCMTSSIGATPVTKGEWHVAGFTYDGTYSVAYLDGKIDERETYNPYLYEGGLHDGGVSGADFTVGAVHRSEEMGNFYTGLIGGLAVFNRALSAEEMALFSQWG
ncbi:hypothetical protein D3C73_871610 [compost metagenome]